MLPESRLATLSEIPIIDLKGLKFSTEAEKRAVGEEMVAAAKNAGFFYISDHGIPQSEIDGIFTATRQFFDLPSEAKEEVSIKKAGKTFNGYLPAAHKGTDAKIKGDLHEAYQCHAELPQDDPAVKAGLPLHGANPWPSRMPELKRTALNYQDKVWALADVMLGLFALGLGLPEKYFHSHFQKPTYMLRLLHYPPQRPDDSSEALGTRAHTDTGAFTILAQDEVGGLEVLLKTGEWVLAPPIKGCYTINIGDVMKMWTDGVFQSTPHRVVNRYGRERYSVPFFANPDYHTAFKPLIKNPDSKPGNFESLFPNTGGLSYGDWIVQVYSRIYNNPEAAAA